MGRETEESSYIIFKDDNFYKAKNGTTGCIEFSGTDAATVIQSAIDALPAEGGSIYVKRGLYEIESTLVPKVPLKIVSERGAKFKYDKAKLSIFASDGVSIKDFIIDSLEVEGYGTGKGRLLYVLKEYPAERVTIRNCKLTDTSIYLEYSKDIVIVDNEFYNISSDFESAMNLAYCERVMVARNKAYTVKADTFVVNPGFRTNVSENYCENFTGVGYCIDMGGATEVACIGNVLYKVKYGILSENSAGRIVIANNTIVGDGTKVGHGIFIWRVDATQPRGDSFIVVGNTVKDVNAGIMVRDEADVVIIGNKVEDAKGNGIVILKAEWGVDFDIALIIGNIVWDVAQEDWREGIGSNSGNVLVAWNRLKGTDHVNTFAFRDATQTTITFAENWLSNFPIIFNTPVNMQVYRNIGYVTENKGTATFTAGITSITVSHGLVNTPKIVLVTPHHSEIADIRVIAKTAIDFTVEVSTAPTANRTFDWYAEV